jgi:hypothetical protein
MPRLKTKPIAKRSLIIDNNSDESQQQIEVKKKFKSNKNKKIYEFIIDKEFEQFLINANFYLTIRYFSRKKLFHNFRQSFLFFSLK